MKMTLLIALVLFVQSASSTKYDPKRNAELDVKSAIAQAQKTGKRVLLEIGGEWCSWCHILDKYFEDHRDLRQLRDQNFVLLKINFSRENENEAVLSRYPKIPGYPHFFVLETDGKLLLSQGTSELEEGKSYNLKRFTDFLRKWSPPSTKMR
jgi:thioredoxin-related protein